MPLRLFTLPQDFQTVIDLIPRSFQYPENEAWSIQPDEAQGITENMAAIRKVWPILAPLGAIIPSVRDSFNGYVWEEDHIPVGLVNVGRQGTSKTWWIGNVAVLPEYRRQGIARKLVEAAVQLARSHDADPIILDVISGNTPAYKLYESIGFVHFTSGTTLDYDKPEVPSEPTLPTDYTLTPLGRYEWRPRYELVHRITPPKVQQFYPVSESRFKVPIAMRPFDYALRNVGGTEMQRYLVQEKGSNRVAAALWYSARLKPGGMNNINITLDPANEEIAPFCVQWLLHKALTIAPARRTEIEVPEWNAPLREAVLAAGFTVRLEMHTLGLKF
jgi:GNAT superfamily N-acetyltransferase